MFLFYSPVSWKQPDKWVTYHLDFTSTFRYCDNVYDWLIHYYFSVFVVRREALGLEWGYDEGGGMVAAVEGMAGPGRGACKEWGPAGPLLSSFWGSGCEFPFCLSSTFTALLWHIHHSPLPFSLQEESSVPEFAVSNYLVCDGISNRLSLVTRWVLLGICFMLVGPVLNRGVGGGESAALRWRRSCKYPPNYTFICTLVNCHIPVSANSLYGPLHSPLTTYLLYYFTRMLFQSIVGWSRWWIQPGPGGERCKYGLFASLLLFSLPHRVARPYGGG